MRMRKAFKIFVRLIPAMVVLALIILVGYIIDGLGGWPQLK